MNFDVESSYAKSRVSTDFAAHSCLLASEQGIGPSYLSGARFLGRQRAWYSGANTFGAQPILRFTPVEVDGRLLIDAPIPDTIAGRDAVAEIRAGVLTSLSVEFSGSSPEHRRGRPANQRWRLGWRWIGGRRKLSIGHGHSRGAGGRGAGEG